MGLSVCVCAREQYSRPLLAPGDDEAVPQSGVHGEHRARVGLGHYSH